MKEKIWKSMTLVNMASMNKRQRTNQPNYLLPKILVTAIVVFGIWSYIGDWMSEFMWVFFLIVWILKLPYLKGFVVAFRKYDLLSQSIPFYAWIYPFFELVLGIGFLLEWRLKIVASITLVVMSIGVVSVIYAVYIKKLDLRCACLGTKLNLPLTTLTLTEDLLMAIMAVIMLI